MNAVVMTCPKDFVDLSVYCPDIQTSVRYGTLENFTGNVLPGYENPCVFLTQKAADALIHVQNDMAGHGFELVIYDGYRPQRTVEAFKVWAGDPSRTEKKQSYYPYFDKKDAFDAGYLASRSPHSRGSTVDLTFIKKGDSPIQTPRLVHRALEDGREFTYLDDASIDTFTHFDFIDSASHHHTPLIPKSYHEPRDYLKNIMEKYGFEPYSKEWWHYKLKNEPHPHRFFDWVRL